ncbi:hypothetical protein ACPRR5_14930 [Enterobacter asburiae]|uniref:hypothetical protein n=1 Tax=Enterobacter asburiae TaxID=61645 RepID=UPI003C740C03
MTRKTLIIGGASGIGFAVGSLLAGRGEEIILAGRDGAKLDARLLYTSPSPRVRTRPRMPFPA